MTLAEKKLNALIDYVLAGNPGQQNKALQKLQLLRQNAPVGQSVEDEVRDLLLKLGVPDGCKGHKFLVTAISMVVKNPGCLCQKVKRFYPAVGGAHGATGVSAERNMRHAIERGLQNCCPDVIEEYFGNTISPYKDKPSVSEYIARVAAVVRRRLK